MPFLIINEADAHGILPLGATEDDVTKHIVEVVSEQINTMVQQAVDAALYIENPSGVKVCRLTGRIVD
jgi:hypothetical protein